MGEVAFSCACAIDRVVGCDKEDGSVTMLASVNFEIFSEPAVLLVNVESVKKVLHSAPSECELLLWFAIFREFGYIVC